mgnify:CR=1 FL=1
MSEAEASRQAAGAVLAVDLDGTLIRSDMLLESFWAALARDAPATLRALFHLRQGRAALKAALEQAKLALGATPIAARPILTQPNGNPMTYFYMAKVMRKERLRLGLEAYDLHALRYRSIKELAWAGCDDDEIAAYSGHATKAMIAKYAGEARQEMRARQAREKRQ